MATSLNGKTIAFLVAPEGVEQVELTEPWKAVERAGGTPQLVSTEVGKVQAFNHLTPADTFEADKAADDVSATDYALVVDINGAGVVELVPKSVGSGLPTLQVFALTNTKGMVDTKGAFGDVYDNLTSTASGNLFEGLAGAINGASVARGTTFLKDRLGTRIFHDSIEIHDDPRRVRGLRSRPFDGEGIPTRRTVVIENGVLKSYLLNTYTAKKLGLQTTANASRGLAGTPGIGPGNYFLQPGTKTPKQIIADIKDGLYVTEFMGHGSNLVTGDYSRGASGLWISGGELAYPVEEITVVGNLKEMFFNITEIANDLEFRYGINAPTVRVEGLTVAGH